MLLSFISQNLAVFELLAHFLMCVDRLLLLMLFVILDILSAVAQSSGLYSVYSIHLIPE